VAVDVQVQYDAVVGQKAAAESSAREHAEVKAAADASALKAEESYRKCVASIVAAAACWRSCRDRVVACVCTALGIGTGYCPCINGGAALHTHSVTAPLI
jgi:hypothetical protein